MTAHAKLFSFRKQYFIRVIEYSFIITHHLFIFSILAQLCSFFLCSIILILFVWAKIMQLFKMKQNVAKSRIETRSIFSATIISIFSTVVRIRFMTLLLFIFTIVHYRTWLSSSIIVFHRRKIAVVASLTSKTNAHCHREISDFTSCMLMLTSLK